MGLQNHYNRDSRKNRNVPSHGSSRNGGTQAGRANQAPFTSEPVLPMPIPADYLEQAEKLMETNTRLVTTSKIRRLFSLIVDIYNEENLSTQKELSQDSVSAIGMARVRFAYECGRDTKVKEFVKKAHLMNYLKGIGRSREEFIKFTQYMEALVAYHKFFGGGEN